MRTGGGSPSTARTIGASVSAADGRVRSRAHVRNRSGRHGRLPFLARPQLVTTGRAGSLTHPDHDGGYIAEPAASPATSNAISSWAAVTPLPQ